MFKYLSAEDFVEINKRAAESYGFEHSVRDLATLETIVFTAQNRFNFEDEKTSILNKVAYVINSLATGHAFTDGNKTTALIAAEAFLGINGYGLNASNREFAEFVLGLAQKTETQKKIVAWLKRRLMQNLPDAGSLREQL